MSSWSLQAFKQNERVAEDCCHFSRRMNQWESGHQESMSQDNGGSIVGKNATMRELLDIRQNRLCRRAPLLECPFKPQISELLTFAVGRLQNAIGVHQDSIFRLEPQLHLRVF